MDGLDRIHDLFTVLGERRGPTSARDLMQRLGCSRPTLYRTLTHARDVYGVPIRNVHGRGYVVELKPDERVELPGLWFNPAELHALLAMQHLLDELEPGILRSHIAPFRARIGQLLDKASPHTRTFPAERIRILAPHRRDTDDHTFRETASALISRRRLHIGYHGRARDAHTERDISPQRLVHYRNNWYLDAWCHTQCALRTFALDRMHDVTPLDATARDVPKRELDAHLATGYGIFAGAAKHTAHLRFTRERARWVADEHWHPHQRGQLTTDGSYELKVPYSDPRELIGEILRHGAEVEVLGPRSLRRAVADELQKALHHYD